MKAIIFLSSDDLIEQLMELHRDVECDDDSSIEDLGPQTSQEYYKGIYSLSLEKIKEYHTDYPYLQPTKKFGCWMI